MSSGLVGFVVLHGKEHSNTFEADLDARLQHGSCGQTSESDTACPMKSRLRVHQVKGLSLNPANSVSGTCLHHHEMQKVHYE